MLNVGIGLVRDLDNKLVGNGKPTCTSNFPAGWVLQEHCTASWLQLLLLSLVPYGHTVHARLLRRLMNKANQFTLL